MQIASLFVALGFKIEGLDQLKEVDSLMKGIAASAKQAVEAVAKLNGVKFKVPTAIPSVVPPVPGAAPRASSSTGYKHPIGPPTRDQYIYEQIKAAKYATRGQAAYVESLKKASTESAKIAGAVSLVTVALGAMVVMASKAALELRNFGLATGLSTDQLQRWQAQADINGASGQELLQTIKGIQSAQAKIALGEGDVAPFQFFGISASMKTDAYSFLQQLQKKVRAVGDNPVQLAIMREMAARIGVSDALFQSLRRQNQELDRSFFLEKEQVEAIDDMRSSWAKIGIALSGMRNKLVAAFASPLRWIGDLLFAVTRRLAQFVDWLAQGGAVANTVKVILAALVALFVAAGVALGAFAAVVGIYAVATSAATAATIALGAALWASGIAEVILAITAAIAAIVLIIGSAILVIDDFWTAMSGGDSVSGDWLVSFFEWAFKEWDYLKKMAVDTIDFIGSYIPDWLKSLFGGKSSVSVSSDNGGVSPIQAITDQAMTPRTSSSATQATQNNNVTVNVDGSDTPKETARVVGDTLKRQISDASYQLPVPSY